MAGRPIKQEIFSDDEGGEAIDEESIFLREDIKVEHSLDYKINLDRLKRRLSEEDVNEWGSLNGRAKRVDTYGRQPQQDDRKPTSNGFKYLKICQPQPLMQGCCEETLIPPPIRNAERTCQTEAPVLKTAKGSFRTEAFLIKSDKRSCRPQAAHLKAAERSCQTHSPVLETVEKSCQTKVPPLKFAERSCQTEAPVLKTANGSCHSETLCLKTSEGSHHMNLTNAVSSKYEARDLSGVTPYDASNFLARTLPAKHLPKAGVVIEQNASDVVLTEDIVELLTKDMATSVQNAILMAKPRVQLLPDDLGSLRTESAIARNIVRKTVRTAVYDAVHSTVRDLVYFPTLVSKATQNAQAAVREVLSRFVQSTLDTELDSCDVLVPKIVPTMLCTNMPKTLSKDTPKTTSRYGCENLLEAVPKSASMDVSQAVSLDVSKAASKDVRETVPMFVHDNFIKLAPKCASDSVPKSPWHGWNKKRDQNYSDKGAEKIPVSAASRRASEEVDKALKEARSIPVDTGKKTVNSSSEYEKCWSATKGQPSCGKILKSFTCNQCNVTFVSEKTYNSHNEENHHPHIPVMTVNGKPATDCDSRRKNMLYWCDICLRSFVCAANFTNHVCYDYRLYYFANFNNF